MKKGVVKRRFNRVTGIFIDGISLDRATKRLHRKVSLAALIQSLSSGTAPAVARYYTIIPHEDDSRHRAYLDALQKAGLEVVVKRLPPKGVSVNVDIYPEMSADITAFSLGHHDFSSLSTLNSLDHPNPAEAKGQSELSLKAENEKKSIVIVCPSRPLSYSISLAKEFGVDTISADFGEFAGRDVLKSAAKWIDLSDSENIWRE